MSELLKESNDSKSTSYVSNNFKTTYQTMFEANDACFAFKGSLSCLALSTKIEALNNKVGYTMKILDVRKGMQSIHNKFEHMLEKFLVMEKGMLNIAKFECKIMCNTTITFFLL